MPDTQFRKLMRLADAFAEYKENRAYTTIREEPATRLVVAWIDADRPFAGKDVEELGAAFDARARLLDYGKPDAHLIQRVCVSAAVLCAEALVEHVQEIVEESASAIPAAAPTQAAPVEDVTETEPPPPPSGPGNVSEFPAAFPVAVLSSDPLF